MNNTTIMLKNLFLGNIDGETESSRDDFEQLFYTSNSKYDEIMKAGKFIISGRKGTGKTILANYIQKRVSSTKGNYCKIINKDEFQLQKLVDLQYRDLKVEELSVFWKWIFLLKLGQEIISNNKLWCTNPFSSERKLKKFLDTKYPQDIFKVRDLSKTNSLKSQVKTGISGKNGVFNPNIAGDIEELVQQNTTYVQKEYFELLNLLEKLVFKCLNKKCYYIIYDDLDEIDSKIGDSSYLYRLLISMMETVRKLNLNFRNIKQNNSKIIILLRSDIIDAIHSNSSNSNKLISEGRVNLYWIVKNYKSPVEHPIMDMLLYKIQRSCKDYGNMDKATLYKLLFPKKIKDKDVIDYLLNHSFGRPRDVIWYLTLITQKFPEETNFEPDHFKDCLQDYSKWFYNELENEISIHERKDVLLDGLKLINYFKKKTFSYEMIEKYYLDNIKNYPHITDLKDALKLLYKLGVIGNSWPHYKKGKQEIYHFSWGYREDANSDPNFSQSFVTHYGLRKHFSL
ncbi:MAG TPA: FunZ [Brevibacillus sp.]|nr:FunZ [Brevibacillus sp.]